MRWLRQLLARLFPPPPPHRCRRCTAVMRVVIDRPLNYALWETGYLCPDCELTDYRVTT